jgi:predicted PurR-regulated permease PerM
MAGPLPSRDANDGWLSRERALALVLIVATAVACYLCYRLARPFLPALAWALALAVVAGPVHDWIAARVRNANVAAALSVVLVALILIAPASLVIRHLVREAAATVEHVQAQAATGRWLTVVEHDSRWAPALRWVEANIDMPGELQRLTAALATDVLSFVRGSVWAVVEILITLFALFYFFRDRGAALGTLRSLVPLSNAETDQVFARVADTIYATIYGTLFVALIQGALGGLIFWWLGLPAPVLWGVVMGLLALIPWLGAFVVWAPAALFLALQGSWGKALILTVWGGVVIALIDNLLYPILVGKKLRLHTLLVFFAIVGGLALFGASGLILGPVILAVTDALVEVWRWRTAGGRPAEAGVAVEEGTS